MSCPQKPQTALQLATLTIITALVSIPGCSTESTLVATGLIGGTAVGAASPSQEIQQIYYLGSFDPLEQLPPSVYRVRVHGQASFLSGMSFASGWVPADLIDPLNTNLTLDATPKPGQTGLTITKDAQAQADFAIGRRFVEFGPAGFRENPKDYRLVVVMGSDPAAYFAALNRVLGLLDPSGAAGSADALALIDRDLANLEAQTNALKSAATQPAK